MRANFMTGTQTLKIARNVKIKRIQTKNETHTKFK